MTSLNSNFKIKQALGDQLGLPLEEVGDMLGYLETFQSAAELQDHLTDILGSEPYVTELINSIVQARFPSSPSPSTQAGSPALISSSSPREETQTLKQNNQAKPNRPKPGRSEPAYSTKNKENGQRPSKLAPKAALPGQNFYRKSEKDLELEEYKVPRKPKQSNVPKDLTQDVSLSTEPTKPIPSSDLPNSELSSKKKSSQIKQNRKECGCYGLNHALFNNCLMCGRVACKEEGPGPCFFCNFSVSSSQQQLQDYRSFREKIAPSAFPDESRPLEQDPKAMAHLARLLEFDRTSASRTKVIDEAADFTVADPSVVNDRWLDPEEKEQAKAKLNEKIKAQEAQRSGPRVLSLDLERRTVSVAPLTVTKSPKPESPKGPELASKTANQKNSKSQSLKFHPSQFPRPRYVTASSSDPQA